MLISYVRSFSVVLKYCDIVCVERNYVDWVVLFYFFVGFHVDIVFCYILSDCVEQTNLYNIHFWLPTRIVCFLVCFSVS